MFPEMKTITPKELEQRLANGEKLNIIDVREDDEIASGMIPSAKHLSLGEFPININYFDKDKEYILVCRSGNRSQMGCEFLEEKGVQVVNMVGGMNNWTGKVN